MPPEMTKGMGSHPTPLDTVPEATRTTPDDTTVRPRRRNSHKQGAAVRRQELAELGNGATFDAPAAGARQRSGDAAADGVKAASLLLAAGATPRDAWIAWLSPIFARSDSAYFTGTYSDEYGYPNGLMKQRNVHKDFARFLESFDYQGQYIVAVEQHQYRDILHLHAILEGPFNERQLQWMKAWWAVERGHARVLPVTDGCASYVTKYALKGDTDSFEWRLG